MNNPKNASKKIDKFVEHYVIENFENIMGDRFGRYSKYIIQDRALPDVRDGLKPVQRRILYSMFKLGLASNKPKKSARIVGDVIGKYHPHGDTAVYDAMVRMSQQFKVMLPLVDMQGNNGSIDGDPAAAMRYTEARMSKYSELMIEDLNKHTVGFVPNFDDEELEPIVLPSKFPNILINGASGISAGYATEIPPHNPGEVIDATIYRINHPNCTTEELMQFVQGPDFPSGGIVQGIDGLRDAYETGRGKVIISSKYTIDTTKANDPRIVITEIPYDVNKALLVKKMGDALQAKNVDGVREILDNTSSEGLQIDIHLRKDVNPETILNFLLKQTDLQTSYNFNVVAISQGRPMQMGLAEILDAYIVHQKEVVTNRSNFELEKDLKRQEVVKGLISMVSILDAVITTIRNSKNKTDAKENIISKYGFTELQAEAIVTLQLYRLTNTDIFALKTEEKELENDIKRLRHILSSETALLKTVIAELSRVKEIIDCPRKTLIQHEITEVEVKTEEFIAKEDVILMITHDGYLKRLSKKAFFGTNEPTKLKDGDVITDLYAVATTDTLIQFTDRGNYIFLPIHKIPESKHKDQGIHISTLIGMEPNEKVIFSFPVTDFKEEKYVLLATKSGLIKRIQLSSLYVTRYSKALKATKLKDDDAVVSADVVKGSNYEVVIATKDGFMNRYDASEVSVIEPASFGVKSIELKNRPNDYVVGAKYVSEKDIVLILTNRGNIKRMRPEEINKGKKNNVGKMYLKAVRSNMHEAIDLEVIHAKNANSDLASYVFCEKGFVEIDYTILRTAIADNGKKFVTNDLGKPSEIVICRNDADLEL